MIFEWFYYFYYLFHSVIVGAGFWLRDALSYLGRHIATHSHNYRKMEESLIDLNKGKSDDGFLKSAKFWNGEQLCKTNYWRLIMCAISDYDQKIILSKSFPNDSPVCTFNHRGPIYL